MMNIEACLYARNFIFDKLHNSKWILERAQRDHELRVDVETIKKESNRFPN